MADNDAIPFNPLTYHGKVEITLDLSKYRRKARELARQAKFYREASEKHRQQLVAKFFEEGLHAE